MIHAQSNDLVLYSYFRSSASYRIRIALNWKELPYEIRPIHLLKDGGEQHSEAYRALNPHREVPTLIYQGRALGQSMAIAEFLEEHFPERPLLPRAPWKRGVVRQFCEIINCTQPLQNLKVIQYLEKEMMLSESLRQRWLQEWIGRGLESMEKFLEKHAGTYCFGGHISLADVFLVPQIFAAQRFNVDLNRYPNISRINDSCLQLEAFKKAHPHRQVDTPPELRIT